MEPSILSRRAASSRSGSHSNYLVDAFMKWYFDQYDPETNPDGYLNLGTAENRLVSDILFEKLNSITRYDPETQYYFDKRGFAKFRSTIASFLDSHLRTTTPLNPDHLIVTNGASPALDTLGHVLADENDAFLGVTPCYRRIENNLGERSRVDMIPVPLSSANDYSLTLEDLEIAYESAIRCNRVVRGIILMNPHNPLGTILSKESILKILEFAKRHRLHVVFDEVFALTVFEPGANFCSVASLAEVLPDPARTHFYWGFSKDMSLSGFRCAVIYSWSEEVIDALTVLTSFHALSAPIQMTLDALLSDREWLDQIYFPENMKRLKTAKDQMATDLRQMGLKVLDCVAGFCLWVDLKGFFRGQGECGGKGGSGGKDDRGGESGNSGGCGGKDDRGGESGNSGGCGGNDDRVGGNDDRGGESGNSGECGSDWETDGRSDEFLVNEDVFFRRLLSEARVYIVPGNELLSKEKGWTRILFACSEPERREFLKRLKKFGEDIRTNRSF